MYQATCQGDRVLIGIVPVATGTICISDPSFVLDVLDRPPHLQKIVEASEKGEYGVEFQKKVMVNTGMDGGFPVYAEYDFAGDFEPSRYIIELTDESFQDRTPPHQGGV